MKFLKWLRETDLIGLAWEIGIGIAVLAWIGKFVWTHVLHGSF